MKKDPPTWVNEYNCYIRKRLGYLMPDQADTWWKLSDPNLAAEVVGEAIEKYALPWLQQMRSRQEILAVYDSRGREFWDCLPLPPP